MLLLLEAVIEQILDLIRGREPNMHHQETSIVEPSIGEVIKEPLKEKLRSHCLIDDNLSQYLTYPNLDSDLDHITVEEEMLKLVNLPLKSTPVRVIGKLKPNLLMFFLI